MRLKGLVGFGLVGLLWVSSGASQAGGDFPQAAQVRLQLLMRKQARETLRQIADSYATGELPARELRWVKTQYPREVKPLQLEASPDGEKLWLEEAGVRVELDTTDLWRRTIRVGGKPFKWDAGRPSSENLRRFDALFPSERTGLDWLLPAAWAEEPAGKFYRLKASGLRLYFFVSKTGENGGELYRLNDEVKKFLVACRTPETPGSKDEDPFLKSVYSGMADFEHSKKEPVKIQSCKDLKALSEEVVGEVRGEPIKPRLPADLCDNVNALAVCTHEAMGSSAVSNGKIRAPKKGDDKDEWYEPGAKAVPKAGGGK